MYERVCGIVVRHHFGSDVSDGTLSRVRRVWLTYRAGGTCDINNIIYCSFILCDAHQRRRLGIHIIIVAYSEWDALHSRSTVPLQGAAVMVSYVRFEMGQRFGGQLFWLCFVILQKSVPIWPEINRLFLRSLMLGIGGPLQIISLQSVAPSPQFSLRFIYPAYIVIEMQ